MARPKGLPKTGGRAPGTPNKETRSVRAAVQEAFDNMGGIDGLSDWGRDNPTEFYKVWARLIPIEANIKHEGGISITVATGVPDAD